MSESKEDYKPTVVLDFDGVVHSYVSGWTGVEPTDPPEEGSIELVRYLIGAGYMVVIQSTRAATQEDRWAIYRWLKFHEFPYRDVDVTNKKVPAIAYVDDRAVSHRPGQDDWGNVIAEIMRLKVGTR